MQTPSVFRSALLLSLLMLLLQGCDRWPADPRDSLDAAIERGSLKVGVVANPPWVSGTNSDAPRGLESQLVTQFARELGMTVEWSTDGVEEQIEALKSFQLDLLIGGFTASNPWKTEVGNTFPYYVERVLVGSKGTPPTTIDGETVSILPHTVLVPLLRDHKAISDIRETLENSPYPVAAAQWQLGGLGLNSSEIELLKHKHVLLTPPGENALLMELERFLFRNRDEQQLSARLWQEMQP
ncbi:extracellular solute-binding protein, family 3 [Halopseudomonas litoralis]|uniref:Extracellular solute-binding protein, family 3 n=1 Tax=Halopseudomonas litoralis TaxID=797277 RepID=A0A1H1V1H6_9GAMM|nr:transporter substrate-binding domain-containing protein [Halopseudomonas litoralis]SDS78226.1 extracellular solute-binding protein, family 3 [Halopseudomonas litoralis]